MYILKHILPVLCRTKLDECNFRLLQEIKQGIYTNYFDAESVIWNFPNFLLLFLSISRFKNITSTHVMLMTSILVQPIANKICQNLHLSKLVAVL